MDFLRAPYRVLLVLADQDFAHVHGDSLVRARVLDCLLWMVCQAFQDLVYH